MAETSVHACAFFTWLKEACTAWHVHNVQLAHLTLGFMDAGMNTEPYEAEDGSC